MADRQPSDDEIMAQAKTSTRVMLRVIGVMMGGLALLAGMILSAVFTGHAEWVTKLWVQIVLAVAVNILFVGLFMVLAKYYKPPLEIGSPRFVRRQIDKHHRNWRIVISANLLTSLLGVISIGRVVHALGTTNWLTSLAFAACVAFVTLMCAVILSVGPGWSGLADREITDILNDEWVRELRARTMRLGYILLMLLLCAAMFVAVLRPALILPVLAWSLYAGFGIPALYYVVADWRAGRDG